MLYIHFSSYSISLKLVIHHQTLLIIFLSAMPKFPLQSITGLCVYLHPVCVAWPSSAEWQKTFLYSTLDVLTLPVRKAFTVLIPC